MTTIALVELDRLNQRLAAIELPHDAKTEIAWADAILELARGLGLALEEQNRIAEHRLRAQRRGGELLAKSGISKGVKSPTLGDFGLDDHESSRWQTIARLPDEVFETYIANIGDKELTTAGLLKLTAGSREPKAIPEPGSVELGGGLLRFSQDLPTATIVALILAVMFPDAETALDATYGSGGFWDGSAHVRVTAHDVDPQRAPSGPVDFRVLSYDNDAFDVVTFDPPHIADAGEDSIMGQRFGTYDEDDLWAVIRGGACECWRVARLGIVVKLTDHIHGQRFQRETGWVIDAIGQEPYDIVHQVRSGALVDPRWEEQLSARNNGATYLIFRKGDNRHVRRAKA